ncbi:hypothetical protein BD626DRAFT_547026 [Schizophyllum amplum]|uniref:ZW10 C-terminal helical domain-containing protein n=1 Tax=Schizophyllum amplum TaxID=97359 RepID=A0A550CLD4_9AGAR|nr:hypothetical protein BD626DRAFT_547026 [Auriculariopsis ampla]
MAFQVPSHLPRRAAPQDVTSAILTKMDEATAKTLDAAKARAWLGDLDETIAATRSRIHERIHTNLPEFERQLETSRAVQQRLKALSDNVDELDDSISNADTGLLPTLVGRLDHISQARKQLNELDALLEAGRLPAAVQATAPLENLLARGPAFLNGTDIIKICTYRAVSQTKTRLDDQLNDAYHDPSPSPHTNNHSTVVQGCPTFIVVYITDPTIIVRRSEEVLSLQDVLASLSPAARTEHLSLLRRDLVAHYIDKVLAQPFDVNLRATPAPPNVIGLPVRLHNMATILEFCTTHIFAFLPPSSGPSFERVLCKPLTDSVLNNLLIPSLPNSWADGVVGHYERQHVVRAVADETAFETFLWETTESAPANAVPIQSEESPQEEGWGFDNAEDAWGLDDDAKDAGSSGQDADADGWGLEDDAHPADAVVASVNGKSPTELETASGGDGWGLDDDAKPAKAATRLEKLAAKGKKKEPSSSSSFSSPPSSIPSSLLSSSPSPPPSSARSPPSARPSTVSASTSTATPSISVSPPAKPAGGVRPRPSQLLVPEQPKEFCAVSTRVQQVLDLVNDVLNEWREFAGSDIIVSASPNPTSSAPGTVLVQSSASVLDLFRALYPVKFSEALEGADAGMRFSTGLAQRKPPEAVQERWAECVQRLKILSESWFYDVIESQRRAVDGVLSSGAQGFTFTGDQDRYDECEAAMSEVLSDIRRLSGRWQGVLAKSKYYTALGLVVDAALSRVLADVLALPDIPEVDSHRLSELCRIVNSLEGLFIEDTSQPSFVVAYVPSWLKFSYLSELLEASMADITYLFETGALVDFSVDELVRLVRALFADTVLRTNTIQKIMEGHPTAAVPEL